MFSTRAQWPTRGYETLYSVIGSCSLGFATVHAVGIRVRSHGVTVRQSVGGAVGQRYR